MTLQELFKILSEGKTLVSVPEARYEVAIVDNDVILSEKTVSAMEIMYGNNLAGLLMGQDWEIKKTTVIINGVELVAPERESLNIGDKYFIVSLDNVDYSSWDDDDSDHHWLENGQIFQYEDDAEKMRRALITLLTGVTK